MPALYGVYPVLTQLLMMQDVHKWHVENCEPGKKRGIRMLEKYENAMEKSIALDPTCVADGDRRG